MTQSSKNTLQEVLGRVGFVAQVLDFAQPMETLRFQADAFVDDRL